MKQRQALRACPFFHLFPIFYFSILHSILLINEWSINKKDTMFDECKYYKIQTTSHLVFRLAEFFSIHHMQNNLSLGLAKSSFLCVSLIHRLHFLSKIDVNFAKNQNWRIRIKILLVWCKTKHYFFIFVWKSPYFKMTNFLW